MQAYHQGESTQNTAEFHVKTSHHFDSSHIHTSAVNTNVMNSKEQTPQKIQIVEQESSKSSKYDYNFLML